MKKTLTRRSILGGLVACPACLYAATPEWNYGEAGPSRWAGLDQSFAVCGSGDQQSPIDLNQSIDANLPAIRTNWKAAASTILNNGHTIQVVVPDGSSLDAGTGAAKLTQFHFHTPSEHAVRGKRSDMEVHFVHQKADGNIVVLGALMGAGGQNNQFSEIVRLAPRQAGQKVSSTSPIDPAKLLPSARDRNWRYEGSLTTPPCSQTVEWILLEQQLSVAGPDIDKFRSMFAMNARPLQPLNRRYILRGR